MMERAAVMSAHRSASLPEYNNSTSTLAFDQHFTRTPGGRLVLAEIVCGMLVWILLGGTDYFRLSALCWVMFVAVSLWIPTVGLFIVDLTGVRHRMPQVPWTTLSLCLNCTAAVLYLVTTVVNSLSVTTATRGRHNYNCWAASAFFASLTTLCYAGSSYLSFQVWKTTREER